MKADDLVQKLMGVVEAISSEKDARESYIDGGGYEWGYHGYPFERAICTSQEEFTKALDEYIDARIEEKLKGIGVKV